MRRKTLEEAYSVAAEALLACGSPAAREALRLIEEALEGTPGAAEEAAEALREAADEARARGCLDWHRLELAADLLEHG